MQFSKTELSCLESVLWRDHSPVALRLDERVINHLLDISIAGQARTSGAQVARVLQEHPRSVCLSFERLERDGFIQRGPYQQKNCTRLIQIIGMRGQEIGDRLPAVASDTDEITCAGWAPPDDWAPRGWFEVWSRWGADLSCVEAGVEAAWLQVAASIHPSELSSGALVRGCNIPHPLEQGIKALFQWPSKGPQVKDEYRRPGCVGDSAVSGLSVPAYVRENEERAIHTPAPLSTPSPAAPKPACGAEKKRRDTPPPPPGHTPIPLSKEKEAQWDEFFGLLGEDFRNAQRMMDGNGWAMFQAFLVEYDPREIDKPVRDAMRLGYQSRCKGESSGIQRPISYIGRNLAWEEGKIKPSIGLVGKRRAMPSIAPIAAPTDKPAAPELSEEEDRARKERQRAIFAQLMATAEKQVQP